MKAGEGIGGVLEMMVDITDEGATLVPALFTPHCPAPRLHPPPILYPSPDSGSTQLLELLAIGMSVAVTLITPVPLAVPLAPAACSHIPNTAMMWQLTLTRTLNLALALTLALTLTLTLTLTLI